MKFSSAFSKFLPFKLRSFPQHPIFGNFQHMFFS